MTEQEFKRLKADVERARDDAERAKGARDVLMKRLKTEFGCKTIEEAETLLKKMTKERDAAEKKLNEAMDDYKEKWDAVE